ncbi:hypothetical protein VPH35_075603 [Triticum aestivum]|nr:uncharacterized protein LOC123090383 [Triticum aestivum]
MERRRLQARQDHDLPDDVLADALRGVLPRWLAASRCVCKAWRRVIDERRLLRTDLLPLSLAGIFIQFDCHAFPEFFACPSRATVNTKLHFLPPPKYPFDEIRPGSRFDNEYFVRDHCHGLLLLRNYVVNPATRRWDPLPPMRDTYLFLFKEYLAFDPTVSPHYQVFRVPYLHEESIYKSMVARGSTQLDPLVEESEWPPSTCIMDVFSSRSGRWEERSFARQGNVAGDIAEARRNRHCRWEWAKCGSAYWQQALYVHCQPNVVMRISLSEDKYRVIEAPIDMNAMTYLGRSKNGVYYASFIKDVFRVWILDESYDQMKWVMKGEYDLKRVRASDQHVHGPWVLEDINYEFFRSQLPEVKKEARVEEEAEWNSDNDDVDDNIDAIQGRRLGGYEVLGFHPFKEILFLSSFMGEEWDATVHAYHLNSSRVECLGNMRPAQYHLYEGTAPCEEREYKYFPYTPCWIGEFHSNKCNL